MSPPPDFFFFSRNSATPSPGGGSPPPPIMPLFCCTTRPRGIRCNLFPFFFFLIVRRDGPPLRSLCMRIFGIHCTSRNPVISFSDVYGHLDLVSCPMTLTQGFFPATWPFFPPKVGAMPVTPPPLLCIGPPSGWCSLFQISRRFEKVFSLRLSPRCLLGLFNRSRNHTGECPFGSVSVV